MSEVPEKTSGLETELTRLMDGVARGEDSTPVMLWLESVVKRYGSCTAVDGIDL